MCAFNCKIPVTMYLLITFKILQEKSRIVWELKAGRNYLVAWYHILNMKTKGQVSYQSRIKWKRARDFVAGFSVSTPCGDFFSTRLLQMTSLYTRGGPQGASWLFLEVRVKWWLLLPGFLWSSWRSLIHTLTDTAQGGSAVQAEPTFQAQSLHLFWG